MNSELVLFGWRANRMPQHFPARYVASLIRGGSESNRGGRGSTLNSEWVSSGLRATRMPQYFTLFISILMYWKLVMSRGWFELGRFVYICKFCKWRLTIFSWSDPDWNNLFRSSQCLHFLLMRSNNFINTFSRSLEKH